MPKARPASSWVRASGGYPYMMQLAGYRSWECSEGGRITSQAVEKGLAVAREELEYRVLAVTYSALSPKDRAFVGAMLQDEDSSAAWGRRGGRAPLPPAPLPS